MYQILVVEDTEEFQRMISRTLGDFKLQICSTAEEGLVYARNHSFDLFIVDINLPKKDGYALVTDLQSDPLTANVPVLFLTGRSGVTDKVTAFSVGADDYITKPFDPIDLRARVEARLRKNARMKESGATTRIGDLEIDHARHRVSIGSGSTRSEVEVTQTEFKLLAHLAKHPEHVMSRDQLLVAAWGSDASVLERVVDVHICLLRKKLGTYAKAIKAVPGVGYKLVTSATKKTAA